MEAIKGFIFNRGEKEHQGKKVHSYLVCFQLVTDTPLTIENETVVMKVQHIGQPITEEMNVLNKYKPPFHLGDASHAIIAVSEMNPNDLEKI